MRLAVLSLLLLAAPLARAEAPPEEVDGQRYNVTLKGGIAGFTGGLAGVTDMGPLWGVQLDSRIWRWFHLEAAYQGFYFPITDTRVRSQALWGEGISLAARASVPYSRRLHPFLGVGGGGWYINPTDGADGLFRAGFTFELPVFAGLEFRTQLFEAGLRGTWRAMFGDQLTDPHDVGPRGGGILSAELTFGLRF